MTPAASEPLEPRLPAPAGQGLDRAQLRSPPATAAAPPRVALMIESDGPGGAEMIVLRMARELRARGYVVCPVLPWTGVGWLGDQLRASGFDVFRFRLRRPIDVRYLREVTRFLRTERIAVVHSHEFTMAFYGALAARIVGIPHVITLHGAIEEKYSVRRRRLALGLAIRLSRAVAAVSAATRQLLIQALGRTAERIVVVPNGVPVQDGARGPTRKQLGIAHDETLLVAVGNLLRIKGHRVLLEALKRLPSPSNSRWRLVIAGGRGGEEADVLEQVIRREGWTDRVSILLGRSDVPDLLAAADIFVMPSLSEGMPLAVLEAMVAGRPIVASRTAGIPEVLRDGQDALLVAPGDAGELAAALARLMEDEPLRRALAESARRTARSRFTIASMVDRYEHLYGIGAPLAPGDSSRS